MNDTETVARSKNAKWAENALRYGVLYLLFALLTLGSRQIPMTADEPIYVTCGYAFLARGREAFPLLTQRGYSPLLIAIEGLPVYLANPSIPLEQLPGWPTDYAPYLEAFRPYMLPTMRTKTLTRTPIIMLTVILGAVVSRWGKDLWGSKAGLLALTALVFDPLLLAHGRMANSDLGTVALGTAALYATWRWARRPSWRWALGTGTLLGLTMLAKVSGLLWTIAATSVVLWTVFLGRRSGRAIPRLAQGLAAIGLSLLVLWAGYGFEWGLVQDVPIPVPVPTHWENLRYLQGYSDVYFALGRRSERGWWWYYPLAFLIKNPLPFLIGWAIGLVALLRRLPPALRLLSLGAFPLLYFSVAVLEGMNLGYRFMLPIHPLLYLTIGGGLAQLAWNRQRAWRWRVPLIALGAWYVISTLRVYPYEISYFNELVGGPEEGYRYLSDSNVDWGQASDVRDAYLQAHPEVIAHPPAAKLRPLAGQYLVGASNLQGVGIGDRDAYEWFRHWEPEAVLHYSLLLYQVPPLEMRWVAQCEQPASPLDAVALASGLGRDDLRETRFDCTQAWLYPDGGATSGVYALHHDLIGEPGFCLALLLTCPGVPADPFIARHLAQARLSFEQLRDSRSPAFAVYEMTSAPLWPPASAMDVHVVPDPRRPDAEQFLAPLEGPIALTGPLAFLAAVAYPEEKGVEVETWWQVIDAPIPRPFSIMGHLQSAQGETVEIVDGLGISPLTLARGDLIVQRHRFSTSIEGTPISLLTGAYWLDTMERWTVAGPSHGDALLVHLNPS